MGDPFNPRRQPDDNEVFNDYGPAYHVCSTKKLVTLTHAVVCATCGQRWSREVDELDGTEIRIDGDGTNDKFAE